MIDWMWYESCCVLKHSCCLYRICLDLTVSEVKLSKLDCVTFM